MKYLVVPNFTSLSCVGWLPFWICWTRDDVVLLRWPSSPSYVHLVFRGLFSGWPILFINLDFWEWMLLKGARRKDQIGNNLFEKNSKIFKIYEAIPLSKSKIFITELVEIRILIPSCTPNCYYITRYHSQHRDTCICRLWVSKNGPLTWTSGYRWGRLM